MAELGPFEYQPRIAVAISGGADSMALALLLDGWARRRGGEAIGLSVDHKLRPEATAEAGQVGRWLAARGIAHHTLTWHRSTGVAAEGQPKGALQARAREARYRLLTEWCRRRGVLHLALAHHAGDQAETVLMRLTRGAGVDGLAGMSAIVSRDGVRLLRPLLLLEPGRLRATLDTAGQAWIEDPSNQDQRFERIRWRQMIPAAQRLTIALAAKEIGEARRVRESLVAELLANARFRPDGSLMLPLRDVRGLAPELALAGLARCLIAIGGASYAPRRESLERLLSALEAGGLARTLGGCRVAARQGWLVISREVGRKTGRQSNFLDRATQALAPGRFTVAKLNVNIM